MTAMLEAIRDKPQIYCPMDDTAPFQDYSGYDRSATVSGGTPVTAISLVAGAVYSTVLNKAINAAFDSPNVFSQGYEGSPFTLESWVYPVTKSVGLTAQAYRENLYTNPSFEVNTSGWSENSGQPFVRISSDSITGAWCCQVTHNTINGVINFKTPSIAVTPGQPYSGGVWVKWVGATPRSIQPRLRFTDAVGGTVDVFANSVTPVSWSPLTWTNVVAPAGAVSLQVWLGATPGVAAAGEGFKVDSAIMENNATSPSFFDGSMPGFEWTGTSGTSTSRVITNVNKVNYALNPTFDTNLNSFAVIGAGGSTWSRVASGGYDGGPFFRATGTVIGQGMGGGMQTSDLPIGTYITSFWFRSSIATVANRFYLEGSASSGAIQTAIHNTGAAIPANTWFNYIFKVQTIRPGSLKPGLNYGSSTVLNETVDYDGFMITLGTAPESAYYDGYTAGGEWRGTAANSESYMLISEADQQILGHSGQYDGLTINGTKVSFTTKYLTTGECRATYDLQIKRRIHAIGVHTSDKNMLFIDGKLVATTEITDLQKKDSYLATDGKLYSGATVSSKHLSINGVGIYASALPADAVARHYGVGNKHVARKAIANIYGGTRIPLSNDAADVFLKQVWTTTLDWKSAQIDNVVAEGDILRPRLVNGTSTPGTWIDTFPMEVAKVTSIYGVNMLWDGEGAKIEASLDGTTWETVERAKNLACVPPGFDPTGKLLIIRISFPGGIYDDTSYVDNMTAIGFKSGVVPPIANRSVTYAAPAYSKNDYEPIELRDDWGVSISNGGGFTIGADTSDAPRHPQTMEVWVKKNDSANFATSFPGAAFYVNGVSSTALATGFWSIFHIVAAAPVTGAIQVLGNHQIGQVVLYQDALTAAQVKEIYDGYIANPTLRVTDQATITITENPGYATIYAHDWAISAAG